MFESRSTPMPPNYLNWTTLRPFLTNDFSRLILTIPIIGYLIIFNDTVSSSIQFQNLAGQQGTLFLSTDARIKFIYFGLIFWATAIALFKWWCPNSVRFFQDGEEFRRMSFRDYSVYDVIRLYLELEEKHAYGHPEVTQFDKDNLYGFVDVASPGFDGTSAGMLDDELRFLMKDVTERDSAFSHSREFITSLLDAKYYYDSREGVFRVFIVSVLSFIAICLLALPSLDVFYSVFVDLLDIGVLLRPEAIHPI